MLVACRVTQHRHHVRRITPAKRQPPGGTPRPPPRHDDCATVGRTVQCRACSSRPSAPRGSGCGHVGISRAGRDVHVPVDTVLWCPSGRHFHSRRPVAQRDRSQPSRETHPCGRADHRAWAPGTLTMTPHHPHDFPKSLISRCSLERLRDWERAIGSRGRLDERRTVEPSSWLDGTYPPNARPSR